MPELGPYGSVRGARGNSRPYRDSERSTGKTALLTHTRSHPPTLTVSTALLLTLQSMFWRVCPRNYPIPRGV
jgi:hypothetical protein